MRLGVRVNAIRSQQTFIKNNPKRRQMLEDLGFDTQPGKSQNRRSLDKDYEYKDEEEEEKGKGEEEEEEEEEEGKKASSPFDSLEGGGGGGGGDSEWVASGPDRNAAEDLGRSLPTHPSTQPIHSFIYSTHPPTSPLPPHSCPCRWR